MLSGFLNNFFVMMKRCEEMEVVVEISLLREDLYFL